MKKSMMISIVSLCVLALLSGCGIKKSGYQVEQPAGQYKVTFSLATPPITGDNPATVVIKDTAGKVITDAQVQIDYSMPAMPGMPAMNYNAVATLSGSEYKALLNLPMGGSWNIMVLFIVKGQPQQVSFSLDAR